MEKVYDFYTMNKKKVVMDLMVSYHVIVFSTNVAESVSM